jgi:hypothetical protein
MMASMARLQSDMGKTKSMVGNAMTGVERSVNMAKRALGALGIGLSATLFVRFVKGTLQAQDELSKLSQKVGISVEGLVGMKHAADLSGVSFEGMQKALKTVSTQMFDASMGLLESKRNFAALNIEIKKTDGTLKGAEAVLIEVADKFAAMRDGTEKTALAVKLFGRAGLDMIPMLNMGSAALAKMVAEGNRLNPTTAESAKQAELFNDNMSRLTKAMGGFAISVLNDVLPAMAKLSESMVRARNDGAGFFRVISEGFFSLVAGSDLTIMQRNLKNAEESLLVAQKNLEGAKSRKGSIFEFFVGSTVPEAEAEVARMEARVKLLRGILADPFASPEAAAAAGGARPRGGGAAIVDETAVKAREKLLDQQAQAHAQRLVEQIERQRGFGAEVMVTEEELAAAQEEVRQAKLEKIREHLAEERSLVQGGAQFWIDTEREKLRQQAEIEQQVRDMRMTTWQMGAELLMQFAGKSKTAAIAVIAINKALAIAQTIQSTSVAIMRAFAELGPIAGAPVAASMKALGAIQVGIITATGLFQAANLGGGGAAAGTPANPISTQPVGNAQATGRTGGQTTIVNLHGQTYTRAQVRELLEIQNENSVDGSRTVVVER